MKRNEINEELTWDLSSLFQDQAAYDKQFQEAQALLTKVAGYKSHIADSKESFISFMEDEETLSRYLDNLLVHPKMTTDVDPENKEGQGNLSKAYTLLQKAGVELSFIPLEIIKHKEQIEVYLNDEACKDFRYPMEEIFRTIPHRLDEEKEAILARVAELERVPSTIYESLRLSFPSVLVDGKEE